MILFWCEFVFVSINLFRWVRLVIFFNLFLWSGVKEIRMDGVLCVCVIDCICCVIVVVDSRCGLLCSEINLVLKME